MPCLKLVGFQEIFVAEDGAHGAYFTLDSLSVSARGVQLAVKKFAAAAKQAKLQHVIWSTSVPCSKMCNIFLKCC